MVTDEEKLQEISEHHVDEPARADAEQDRIRFTCYCEQIECEQCSIRWLIRYIRQQEERTSKLKEGMLVMANRVSDATRLLPMGGDAWRSIRLHLLSWKNEDISESKLRELIVEELRGK